MSDTISAIIPTIGRVNSLGALLDALADQTRRPDEVIVADGSDVAEVRELVSQIGWRQRGLEVHYLRVVPPNAVRQRTAAIAEATGNLLLMLDDDVVPERLCVEALTRCMNENGAVAVGAQFSNHAWPRPTMLWRLYLRLRGISGHAWQGRVLGPLLRFGYNPAPAQAAPMEWIGAGHTLMRRDAFDRVGGFSDFFLHRSTVNEDVDLSLRLARIGPILLCPSARMAHLHEPAGRASVRIVAEDDVYNRYRILRQTLGRSAVSATALILVFIVIETLSGVFATVKRFNGDGFAPRLIGRLRGLIRIATS